MYFKLNFRYSYDPFQHSPNENPEAELAVNAGDYVLVWGPMDEVAPPTIVRTFLHYQTINKIHTSN